MFVKPFMQESFSSFNRRIDAGLPLVSDEEKEFENEEKEIQSVLDCRRERREKLLWKSIPLLARNWKLFRKYPKLYNIPIDFVFFGDFFGSEMWWENPYPSRPLGGLVAAWKTETCQLSCPCCQDKAYLVPQHKPERSFSCIDFFDGPSNSEDDDFWNPLKYSNPYHVYCEKCGEITNCYDLDAEMSEKCSKFGNIMRQWNRRANPAVPPLQFEHALHLLALRETCGEESDEFQYRVYKDTEKKSGYGEFDF